MINHTLNYEDEGIDLDNFNKEEEIAKFKDMGALGWNIVIRLYTSPKKKGGIILPDTVRNEDQYRICTGLVVKVSPAAYKDARYSDTGAWCEVGDWIVFPRHAGYKVKYKDIPIFILKEDAVDLKIANPLDVTK